MAGAAVNRKDFREKIDALLKAKMGSAGSGIVNDTAFYPYKVGDFNQQFPVIVTASEGSERDRPQRGGDKWDTNLYFTVWVFVAYAIESTTEDWDEQDAEDALDLIDKTTIVEDAELNKGYPKGIPNDIHITCEDGTKVSKRVDFPRGHAENPMTDDEVVAKFKRMAAGVVSDATADKILDTAWKLDTMDDVTALFTFDVI